MIAKTRDDRRFAHPGMRVERLLNTRYYNSNPKARRRLFVAVYGRLAMFRKRSKRFAVLIAILKAMFAKRLEHDRKVHHVYQAPRVLQTQRR